jgi:hypothetical protein
MPKRVYVETTIPSYLAAWPSRDLLQAARQQLTHDWWDHHRHEFMLCASEVVIDETVAGDPDAATRRAEFLKGIALLDLTPAVEDLAAAILDSGLLPPDALRDASHIAVASVHDVDILLTWNCRHIANATILRELEELVDAHGYRLPVICTPEELIGE